MKLLLALVLLILSPKLMASPDVCQWSFNPKDCYTLQSLLKPYEWPQETQVSKSRLMNLESKPSEFLSLEESTRTASVKFGSTGHQSQLNILPMTYPATLEEESLLLDLPPKVLSILSQQLWGQSILIIYKQQY